MSTETASPLFLNLNSRGQYIGEYYGLRNRQFLNGTYRWNKETNCLEFGDGSEIYAGAQMIVEYKSDFGEDMHRLVPKEWAIAISYKIMEMIAAWKDPSKSEAMSRKFIREYQTIKRQAQYMDLKQWHSAIEEARYGGPKW